MKRIIHTDKAPEAIGPYSQAVEVNGTLYVSGQAPFVPASGQVPSEDIREQTKQSLENVKAVVEAAGYSMEDVVKATVFVKDMNDFTAVNEVYAQYLGETKPARSCVEAARLPRDIKVEIEVVAAK